MKTGIAKKFNGNTSQSMKAVPVYMRIYNMYKKNKNVCSPVFTVAECPSKLLSFRELACESIFAANKTINRKMNFSLLKELPLIRNHHLEIGVDYFACFRSKFKPEIELLSSYPGLLSHGNHIIKNGFNNLGKRFDRIKNWFYNSKFSFSKLGNCFSHLGKCFSNSANNFSNSAKDFSHFGKRNSNSANNFSKSAKDFSLFGKRNSNSAKNFSYSAKDFSHLGKRNSNSAKDFSYSARIICCNILIINSQIKKAYQLFTVFHFPTPVFSCKLNFRYYKNEINYSSGIVFHQPDRRQILFDKIGVLASGRLPP
jgi:hypothetical protein